MQVIDTHYDVGIMVARFQLHALHQAHRDLIDHVLEAHDKAILFLGLAPVIGTKMNPLDFEARKQMVLAEYPQLNVLYIDDVDDDIEWSRRLDKMVGRLVHPNQTAVLYGSRDSFLPHYHGELPTRELTQDVWVSGTEIRKEIGSKSVKASPDFRAGVIWATQARYPTVYATVDVAIFNEDGTKILLGRKPGEKLFRLIGGFADVRSLSFEEDARREVREEAGIEITDPIYIGSFQVDDWRYRSEEDVVRTLLFVAKHQFGAPHPADDIAEVRWFTLSELVPGDVMQVHWPLLKAIESHRNPKIQIEGTH